MRILESSDRDHMFLVTRLQARPFRGQQLFDAGAVKAIYGFSKGTPRVINTLCDTALVTAYARNHALVTKKIIKEVIRDMKESYATGRTAVRFKFAWVAGPVILFAGLVIAALFYGAHSDDKRFQDEPQPHAPILRGSGSTIEPTQSASQNILVPMKRGAVGKGPEASKSTPKPSVEALPPPVDREIEPTVVTQTPQAKITRPVIKRSAISQGIRNREPVGHVEQISLRQRQVYCWLHVVDGEGQRVTTRWISKGDQIAEISLPIGSDSWRTWSSVTLRPSMIGPVQVEIFNEHGDLLKTLSFEVTEE
jgi:hypothetical protein